MKRVTIVGVLNVTPDSYHDGGKFQSVDAALAQAEELLKNGADLIDIGGESTFVDRQDVSADEELRRVLPVIEGIMKRFPSAKISIDTYKASVAKAAIDAGAVMVNDVTAGRGDAEMFTMLARESVRVVLMYAKDATSRTTTDSTHYEDVMTTVIDFLRTRIDLAVHAGIQKNRIIVDPGLGFFVSGEPKYSFDILANLGALHTLGCPIYLSPSRKSFLAGSEKLKTPDRLPGTIAASAIAVLHGAEYIRTHDVLEVRRACDIALAIRDARRA